MLREQLVWQSERKVKDSLSLHEASALQPGSGCPDPPTARTPRSRWSGYGLRQLRKSLGFTIAAVSTLAVAIGVNAVVFAALDGLVFRPLNVPRTASHLVVGSRKSRLRVCEIKSIPDSYEQRPKHITQKARSQDPHP